MAAAARSLSVLSPRILSVSNDLSETSTPPSSRASLRSSFLPPRPAPAERKTGRKVERKRLTGGASVRASTSVQIVPQLSKVSKWDGVKRIQTQTSVIAPDTTTIRSLDWDRDRFDIEFGLQNGTTYNSFIIEGAEKTAIIDASHDKFRELYFDALRQKFGGRTPTFDYVVANHTEPDHSALIRDLVELNPDVTVVGSKVCIAFLKNLLLKPFNAMEVKSGDTLDLGGGHVLEFLTAPNLHWPDTMFTFDRKTNLLFTCDAFGMHYCTEEIYDTDLPALEGHFRFYYDCLMRPNAKSVLTMLRKITANKHWEVAEICTGHGPLLRFNVSEWMFKYKNWSDSATQKQPESVVLFYVSDYGYSDRLSQALARGISKTGVQLEMLDLNAVEVQESIEAIGRSNAVVVMAPPLDFDREGESEGGGGRGCYLPHANLNTIFAAVKAKQPVLVAESYGGNDEPVDSMVFRFNELGIKVPFPALRVKDVPTEATYQLFEEAGTDLAQSLHTSRQSVLEKRNAMDIGVSKAIARISGGLYVVTAKKGDSKGAMVASWVSQASFKPIGITIAVAKDRAIESLMQVGDSFVLNCLEDGNFNATMKHFLKRFPPGADRFEGVETFPASNGCPILSSGCIAYLECVVVQRMETNDHWITYAHVTEGNVAKSEGRTASHHRKIGDYY